MGVNGLLKFIRQKSPGLIVEIPIESLFGQRIAVDASVYLYKFVCIENSGGTKWYDMFFNLVVWLRSQNIRPVFVFDGKPPDEKTETQQKRRDTRKDTMEKIQKLEKIINMVDELENDEVPTKILVMISNAMKIDMTGQSIIQIRYSLYEQYKKEKSRHIEITPEHPKIIKRFLDLMGLPWFQATGEAEKTCAWLCKYGYVKGVVSTDSDLIAYCVPVFIQNVHAFRPTCNIIRTEDVLESFEFTEEQLRDFCLMCGTDYNSRIYGIGPVKSFDLLTKHQSLEQIEKSGIDTSSLYYQNGRQLFTLPKKDCAHEMVEGYYDELTIPRIKEIDSSIDDFLEELDSSHSYESIMRRQYKPVFVTE